MQSSYSGLLSLAAHCSKIVKKKKILLYSLCLLSHFLHSFTGFFLLYLFSFFLIGSFYFFLSPTLLPLPSLARPSLSHWFPMGASYSASVVTVGHTLVVDRIWWWVKFCDVLILCLWWWLFLWFGGWVFVLWLVIWWFVMDGFWWLFCNWWFVMAGFW